MQIDLSPAEEAEIRRQASAVGYDNPARYLIDLAIHPESTFRPLDPAELRESAAMCDEGMRDAESGRVMSVEEAREQALESLRRNRSRATIASMSQSTPAAR